MFYKSQYRLSLLRACFIALLIGVMSFKVNAHALPHSEGQVSARVSEISANDTLTQQLNTWFDHKYDEWLQFSPMTLTHLGTKERYGEIDDMSEAAELARLNWRKAAVNDMRTRFDYDRLTPEAKTSYDIFIEQYEYDRLRYQYRRQAYMFTQFEGIHVNLPNFLINQHKVDTPADMDAYISRIEALSRAITQLLERAQENAKFGTRPPYFAYEDVIEKSQQLLQGAPFKDVSIDAPLMADVKNKIKGLQQTGLISDAEADAYYQRARQALIQHFQPAYQRVIDWFMEDKVNVAAQAKGVGALPNGEAFFQAMLRVENTTHMTAEDIHQLGLREVARLRAEMESIKHKLGFKGSLQEFFNYVKSTPDNGKFFYPNTDAGRQDYIDDSSAFLAEVSQKLPMYFGVLPQADLIVKRVESFREQAGAAQHYYAGTPDGSRPGVYYAHLSDMTSMPKIEMEAIAYHEGNPGHHMQISIAQELQNIPRFRTQASFTGFVEGWAVYSEVLAKEMGAYQDPYSEFGRLVTEIWRAIRLVLDTGINAKGWSEEQAIAFFRENSPRSDTSILSEVRRYFVWPGQATAYKLGQLKILSLRERARTVLVEEFDIRAFHDLVLSGGALPLSILEKRVEQWIASQRSEPR